MKAVFRIEPYDRGWRCSRSLHRGDAQSTMPAQLPFSTRWHSCLKHMTAACAALCLLQAIPGMSRSCSGSQLFFASGRGGRLLLEITHAPTSLSRSAPADFSRSLSCDDKCILREAQDCLTEEEYSIFWLPVGPYFRKRALWRPMGGLALVPEHRQGTNTSSSSSTGCRPCGTASASSISISACART